jgi:uncharacterized protein (DUF1499 family)
MKKLKVTLGVIAGLVVLGIAYFAILSMTARRPDNLGARGGKLAACPSSPNCVCSQGDPADAEHFIAALDFSGTPADALQRLHKVVTAMPRTNVVTQGDDYMHVEFTSTLFRYVDDVEFVVDEPAHQIHVRSASRVGHSDLGANRKRVEAIRANFEAAS